MLEPTWGKVFAPLVGRTAGVGRGRGRLHPLLDQAQVRHCYAQRTRRRPLRKALRLCRVVLRVVSYRDQLAIARSHIGLRHAPTMSPGLTFFVVHQKLRSRSFSLSFAT